MSAASEVRASYDTVAVDYEALLRDELDGRPLERALLTAFAEMVGAGPVADVGCGPGRVAAHLQALGLDVFGIDLSPGMVDVARAAHPGIRFEVSSMTALDVADGGLAGVLAWYSVVHMPDSELPAVFGEFARVLRPGGSVLLAFHLGDDPVHLDHAYGHPLSLDVHPHQPDHVASMLSDAGFGLLATMVRAPDGPEKRPRAYLLATLERVTCHPDIDDR
ncbi:Methyltransferase domain-containing protein [Nakamurella panacisegetis]|uniref:Methyltransferase domain-containing protein n=1 Tax=Nakamurella panacisegetis TaxID=1090615 RepID=A0A1H0RYR9_9ACTN|nr:class I SAM-dependent methyltransferase [Nakamurella panacisegetis]SDP34630.1 Methyltransferase domain-containing protein [Nakamurella panacisegetis]